MGNSLVGGGFNGQTELAALPSCHAEESIMQYRNENSVDVQELSHEELDQVSGGFLFLVVLAAVALGGCLADCGHPPVQHP